MSLTLNPLMGNVSSSYAVKAGRDLALCSRFNFNFYSYESDVQVGMELWRRKTMDPATAWARDLLRPEWKDGAAGPMSPADEHDGVLKARVDQNWKIGVLWEGRVKDLIVSIGAGLDLKRTENVLGSVGVHVSYSS